MTSLENFIQYAEEFCFFVENHRTIRESDYSLWLEQIVGLYRCALELDYPPSVSDENDVEVNIHLSAESDNFYWMLYNPLVLEEPVGGILIDDIQDIYREIKKGIMFFQTNPAAALWEWKFGFDNHWGNHAVDAIRALHYMIRR